MNPQLTEWLKRYGFVSGAGLFFAFTALLLAMSVMSGTPTGPSKTDLLVADLEDDKETLGQELAGKHSELLDQLPGPNAERVARDEQSGRSLVLALSSTSTSSLELAKQQTVLNNRYDFLDANSPVLTEFLPEWVDVTAGQQYRLTSFDVQVTSVQSLDYGYTAQAVLETPDSTDEKDLGQVLLIGYTTRQNGSVTSLEAYLASTDTRDAVLSPETESPTDDQTPAAEQTETSEQETSPTTDEGADG